MGWYEIMRDAYDDTGNSDAVAVGDVRFVRRAVFTAGLLVALLVANHFIRLASGKTSWLSYQETFVIASSQIADLPRSVRDRQDDTGLRLPVPARPGEELVVQYRLDGSIGTTARLLVSCGVPCRQRNELRIDGPGSGEFAVPASEWDFYRLHVFQTAGRDGSSSKATYWFGVRNVHKRLAGDNSRR